MNMVTHTLFLPFVFSSPKVSIGKYSPRVFFTDKIRDWPFK